MSNQGETGLVNFDAQATGLEASRRCGKTLPGKWLGLHCFARHSRLHISSDIKFVRLLFKDSHGGRIRIYGTAVAPSRSPGKPSVRHNLHKQIPCLSLGIAAQARTLHILRRLVIVSEGCGGGSRCHARGKAMALA